MCLPGATALHDSYCAHHDKQVTVGSSTNASVKLFGKDLSLFNNWANASSSNTDGTTSSWGFALGGYTVWTSPITGRYATPAISTTALSPTVVSIQGYLFQVSVGLFGQLTAQGELYAKPGSFAVTANAEPGGELGGIVIAGPAAPGYTVGVTGTLELLSVQAPLKAAVGPSGTGYGYSLSRQVYYHGGAGNVSFGVFGPNLPPNVVIPVVTWPGIGTSGPLVGQSGALSF